MNSILKSLVHAFWGAADLGLWPLKEEKLTFCLRVKNATQIRITGIKWNGSDGPAWDMGMKEIFFTKENSQIIWDVFVATHLKEWLRVDEMRKGMEIRHCSVALFHLCSLVGLKGYFSVICRYLGPHLLCQREFIDSHVCKYVCYQANFCQKSLCSVAGISLNLSFIKNQLISDRTCLRGHLHGQNWSESEARICILPAAWI